MSREAVDLPLADLYRLDEQDCWALFVEARFGGKDTVRCPYCGSIGRHYFRVRERRWKCHGCGSTFSITTGTVFAQHKISLRDLLIGALTWINSAAGQPALELKRHVDKTYNTVFTLQHKLREALVRGYNVGLLNGDLEIDGAYQSGFKSKEKRGKPRASSAAFAAATALAASTAAEPSTEAASEGAPIDGAAKEVLAHAIEVVPAPADEQGSKTNLSDDEIKAKSKLLTWGAQSKARYHGKKADPEAFAGGLASRRSPDARILIAVRKRSGVRGRGAAGSRVAIALSEDEKIAASVFADFVATSESYLNSDGATGYTEVGKGFLGHRTVTHSKELVGPNGENNNQAEEFNFRFDRAEKGIYTNIEAKYLLDYAVEVAFRSDTRRMPNGMQLRMALKMALSVGVSQYWRGFTHGRHRPHEPLRPVLRLAPSSGPAKGRHPISSANGRPPR